MDEEGADRRRFERFHVPSAALRLARPHRIVPAASAPPIAAEVANVSAGGLQIRTGTPVKVGDAVGGRIELPPGGEPIEFSGRVIWVVTIPPTLPGDAPSTVAGICFDKADAARDARIEAMRAGLPKPRGRVT